MSILILDNYDSFTYNLFHYCLSSGADVTVKRNDEIELEEVNQYDKIILSPGPGLPDEAGIMPELIKTYFDKKSILGVCLGMQGIAEFFGCRLRNLGQVLHGKQSRCRIVRSDECFFNQIPEEFMIGHYHSWVIDENSLEEDLQITVTNSEGLIMAFRHKSLDLRGVQFHPESILTEHGKKMIHNWVNCPLQ